MTDEGNVIDVGAWLSGRARSLMEVADRCERFGRRRAADQYRRKATGYLLRMLDHYSPTDDGNLVE